MKHAEKVAPLAAAASALATLACCLPLGIAAAAATATMIVCVRGLSLVNHSVSFWRPRMSGAAPEAKSD